MAGVLSEIDTNRIPKDCGCSKLFEKDIPGATLISAPEKCKVSDLKIWLKCRGQKVKSKENKAELCVRVKKCLERTTGFELIDPYPGQPYLNKKKAACSFCIKSTAVVSRIHESKELEWKKDAACIPRTFNYVNILEYSKLSGKNSHDVVEKPMKRGYTLFYDGYVHDVLTSLDSKKNIHVKSKCFKSMKKNEMPHDCKITLDNIGNVKGGKCSCVAGASGFCNHVFGLLYLLDHYVKTNTKEIERELTCTERRAEWPKCRTDGVRSEPVMSSTVVKPKYGSSSYGIRPLLHDNRLKTARDALNSTRAIEKLKLMNPLIGLCQVCTVETSPLVETRLNVSVPVGSALSYQLSKTEGDFEVTCNIEAVPQVIVKTDNIPKFPWIANNSLPDANVDGRHLTELDLTISQDESDQLEVNTKEQANTQAWFDARKFRLTASTFGKILSRKKDKEAFVTNSLLTSKSLSHIPAVKYGIQNEGAAVRKYAEYMNNCRKKTTVLKSGVVVNTNMPWLAASPDRIICSDHVGYGLLEVKCAYSKKTVTPKDACMDPAFFCHIDNGLFKLKTDHDYYAQVQGQLGICGASYCDFVVYTNRGLGIERIPFDNMYFSAMVLKLKSFFVDYFVKIAKKQRALK